MKSSSCQQLLDFPLASAATFETFIEAGDGQVTRMLKEMFCTGGFQPQVFLWGQQGVGKTHLLQAVCHYAGEQKVGAIYLPLKSFVSNSAVVLDGLESMPFICVDDLDTVCGIGEWERALFNLINRSREFGTTIIFASTIGLQELRIELRDLQSRLSWGPVFRLEVLSEDQRVEVLRKYASVREFDLPDEVISYLLNHFPRDLASMLEVLGRLDEASLREQRKITVPFLKQLIALD